MLNITGQANGVQKLTIKICEQHFVATMVEKELGCLIKSFSISHNRDGSEQESEMKISHKGKMTRSFVRIT
jgi:hypothetical protein